MEIRRLAVGDIEFAHRAIVELKIKDEGRTGAGLPEAQMRSFLANSANLLIVASADHYPVGFLIAYLLDRADREKKMVLLYEIGVAANYRRRGIGRAMIDVLKDEVSTNDLMKMWVHTNRSNKAAIALYSSTGGIPDASGDEISFLFREDVFR